MTKKSTKSDGLGVLRDQELRVEQINSIVESITAGRAALRAPAGSRVDVGGPVGDALSDAKLLRTDLRKSLEGLARVEKLVQDLHGLVVDPPPTKRKKGGAK